MLFDSLPLFCKIAQFIVLFCFLMWKKMLLNIYIYRSDLFNVVSHNFYVFVHNDKSDVFKIRRNNYLCDLQKILLVTFGRGI